jgi:hypothetical protein
VLDGYDEAIRTRRNLEVRTRGADAIERARKRLRG